VQATNPVVRKRALVVDDSKSARVVLSRMLEKYDIDVDMAESAEAAIEYLKHERPDAIFMDQLMPGMDGLQAVQLIKGNPQTATIPIMMYTSQSGELYVGQARALGAMGVLPKQVRPVDVSKVLYELHLLPDRRTLESALVPVEVERAAAEPAAPPPDAAHEWGAKIEAAVKQQSVDLRRFIVASLDSFAARLAGDLKPLTSAAPIALNPVPESPPARPARPLAPWIGAALAALAAVAGLALWIGAREELARTRAELAAAQAREANLTRSREQLDASLKELSAALASASAPLSPTPAAPAAGALGGLPRFEPVPYGEAPFDRQRVEMLREVLAKLEAQGFHGVLRVVSSVGLFCLSGNPTDGFTPASPSLPASKCDLVGNPFEESQGGQAHQSLAFANLVAGARQRSGGAFTVALESGGSSHPATAYPSRSDTLTAGDWNRAAQANNRVEFIAEPASRVEPVTHGEEHRSGD